LAHSGGDWEVQAHGGSIFSAYGEDLLVHPDKVEGITWQNREDVLTQVSLLLGWSLMPSWDSTLMTSTNPNYHPKASSTNSLANEFGD
jgi:hypothetical protein